VTTTLYRPAVRELHDLRLRRPSAPDTAEGWHLGRCWLSCEDAGRYSLIVPALYGPLDFLRLVTAATVEETIAAGLVVLGEPVPMPPYNYGGPRYRWRTIQQGQTVALTERGMEAAR
jgi:hypothetical protein